MPYIHPTQIDPPDDDWSCAWCFEWDEDGEDCGGQWLCQSCAEDFEPTPEDTERYHVHIVVLRKEGENPPFEWDWETLVGPGTRFVWAAKTL